MNLHKILALATAAPLAVAAASANAQTMKPGLWEMTNKMGGSPEMDQAMAQLQQQMANMPPEQRKMMEDMMAKKGMGMGGVSPGGIVVKACITKEMAERNQMPMQHSGDCTNTISDKTSTGMKMKFTCTNPPSSGEGQFSFMGDTAYTMKMKISTAAQGKPQVTTVDGSGKWVNSDCGNITPMAMPKK
jgi:Protein of unknown function (DUF3617)